MTPTPSVTIAALSKLPYDARCRGAVTDHRPLDRDKRNSKFNTNRDNPLAGRGDPRQSGRLMSSVFYSRNGRWPDPKSLAR